MQRRRTTKTFRSGIFFKKTRSWERLQSQILVPRPGPKRGAATWGQQQRLTGISCLKGFFLCEKFQILNILHVFFYFASVASTLCLRHFATFEAKLHCRREVSNLNCTPMRLEWTKRTKHANLNFEVLANRACLINASGPLDLKPSTVEIRQRRWAHEKTESKTAEQNIFGDSEILGQSVTLLVFVFVSPRASKQTIFCIVF